MMMMMTFVKFSYVWALQKGKTLHPIALHWWFLKIFFFLLQSSFCQKKKVLLMKLAFNFFLFHFFLFVTKSLEVPSFSLSLISEFKQNSIVDRINIFVMSYEYCCWSFFVIVFVIFLKTVKLWTFLVRFWC